MKPYRLVASMLVFCAGAFAADQPKPNPVFDKLKALVGTWTAPMPRGGEITNSYRLTSGGSVLMQTTTVPGEGEMITMYHRDGDAVIATHYCIAQNQPRYTVLPTSDPNVLELRFKDATNLATPESGHMHGGTVRFVDADHYIGDMVWLEAGKERREAMAFVRKK